MDGHRQPFGNTFAHCITNQRILTDILTRCEKKYYVRPHDISEKIFHESMIDSFIHRHVMACFGFQGANRFSLYLTRYQNVPYAIWIPHTTTTNLHTSFRQKFFVSYTVFPESFYDDTLMIGEWIEDSKDSTHPHTFYVEQCILWKGSFVHTKTVQEMLHITSKVVSEWKPTRMDPIRLSIKPFYGLHELGQLLEQDQTLFPIQSVRIYGLRTPITFYIHKMAYPHNHPHTHPQTSPQYSFAHSLQTAQQQRNDLEYVYRTRETHSAPSSYTTTHTDTKVDYPEQKVWLKSIPIPNLFGVYTENNPLECIGIARIIRFEDVERVNRKLQETPTGVRAWVQYSAEFHKFVFLRFAMRFETASSEN